MHKLPMKELEDFSRTPRPTHYFMGDIPYSKTSQVHNIPNLSKDSDLAIQARQQHCANILELIQDGWRRITLRSAFCIEAANQLSNNIRLNSSPEEAHFATHIWDFRAANGQMGITTCIAIPSLAHSDSGPLQPGPRKGSTQNAAWS